MYGKFEDDSGQTYYKRTAYARGRPNLPGVVEGEIADEPLIRPNLKYFCAATLDVKKGNYYQYSKNNIQIRT